jgi:prepilin-type N-terminal cleavage/methylation domain-containing protein
MRARTQLHAFTLVEAMVALAIIAIVSALGFGGLTMANQYAMVARLYTVAEETARNQIDQIESATPYNPQLSQTPPVLTPGTTTSTVPLYVDPPTNTTVVSGTMTTVIASLGSYNGVTGTVTVTFSYRNHNYTVAMNTIRVSDNP